MVTGHACHLSSTYSLILGLLPPASQQLVKSTFNLLHMAKTQLADTNAHSSNHPQWRPHSSGDKCHTFIREESHKEEVHGKKGFATRKDFDILEDRPQFGVKPYLLKYFFYPILYVMIAIMRSEH